MSKRMLIKTADKLTDSLFTIFVWTAIGFLVMSLVEEVLIKSGASFSLIGGF